MDAALVIGGGTMGAGIAQSLLESGLRVTVREADDAAAAAARDRILAGIARRAERGRIPAEVAGTAGGRLDTCPTTPPGAYALVIESVPENVELKRAVLAEVSAAVPDAVIGTNTSALSIDELAKAVHRPERFAGLHFFNPVPASVLVEVVRGAATSAATLATCHGLVERIGKESIEVADAPGFATSRLGVAIGLEAMRMLEEGVASAADIDTGMVKGYRFPIGPLALSDVVGLDVRLAIAEHLHAELGERFRPPPILRALVERGELGKKTGRGFYDWDAAGRSTPRSDHP